MLETKFSHRDGAFRMFPWDSRIVSLIAPRFMRPPAPPRTSPRPPGRGQPAGLTTPTSGLRRVASLARPGIPAGRVAHRGPLSLGSGRGGKTSSNGRQVVSLRSSITPIPQPRQPLLPAPGKPAVALHSKCSRTGACVPALRTLALKQTKHRIKLVGVTRMWRRMSRLRG